MLVHMLMHFRNFAPGEALNTERHGGKRIGVYTRESKALAAIRRVARQPGFIDHPDGFRLFTFEVDRDHWAGGFWPGPDGIDIAIAGDSSGIVGNDDGLAEYGDDTSRNFEREREYVDNEQTFRPGRELWALEHFKISYLSSQYHEDMGHKLVGLYSTRAKLAGAVERLRVQPGFNTWPDGFRIYVTKLNGLSWDRGFAAG
jgi:hypothetical protein